MRIPVRAMALGALLLIPLATPADAAKKAKAARKAECRAACGPVVEAQCGALRPRKARACGRKVQRSCQRRGVLAVCPPTSEPTTTGTPGTPTTLVPVATTTTTTPAVNPTTTTTTLPAPTCGGYILLTATDSTYLGCVTCPTDNPDSIFNDAGAYGSPAGPATIHDHTGVYGSPDSNLSACNETGTASPSIVDQQGCYYGRMTINPAVLDGPCGVSGDDHLCGVLRDICAE